MGKVKTKNVTENKQTQEALALLKMLALSGNNMKKKNYKSLDKTFMDVRIQIDELKKVKTIKRD